MAQIPKLTARLTEFTFRDDQVRVGELEVKGSASVRDRGVGNAPATRFRRFGPASPISRGRSRPLVGSTSHGDSGGGTLAVSGTLRPPPTPSQVQVRLSDLDLAAWNRFLPVAARLNGRGEADLRIDEPLAAGVPTRVNGSIAVNRLGVETRSKSSSGAQRVEATGLEVRPSACWRAESRTRKALTAHLAQDEVVAQLAAALRARGHQVDEQVGQSRFRCDLALREGEGQNYRLGVLVDTEAQYANPDVLERCVARPRILDSFGWRVVQVLSRDWLHQPQGVLDRIERVLHRGVESEAEGLAEAEGGRGRPLETRKRQAAPDHRRRSAGRAAGKTAGASLRRPGPRATSKCVEGNARKFWRIQQDGTDVSVAFGRIGTRGQVQLERFCLGGSAPRARSTSWWRKS